MYCALKNNVDEEDHFKIRIYHESLRKYMKNLMCENMYPFETDQNRARTEMKPCWRRANPLSYGNGFNKPGLTEADSNDQ
jgi:hypothetical protein